MFPNLIYLGATSLMYASGEGNLSIVRILLEKGAQINKSDRYGKLVYISSM